MNILLVYPETPATFWSFCNAVKFISKKSSEIPLGLITVAALLPEGWNKRLIDMNVTNLKNKDIAWADYVFISGMNIHMQSIKKIIKRCLNFGVKIVAGGPMVTTDYQEFQGVDHFILNEAEITLPQFLKDLEKGEPKPIYTTEDFPDLSSTPVPLWRLLDMKKYAGMNIQYSRGCPYDCEFCSITMLNGRKPRTKTSEQFLNELTSLYQQGWRNRVFVVDDNFIGNKKKLKTELLPALIKWSKARDYPFSFTAETTINLADDKELLNLMVQAGFSSTFIGIETPNSESLSECGKSMNLQRDMVESVKCIQRSGLMVMGGFIVGFDKDPDTIFDEQINFIQKSGIVTAMVGLLNAISGTKLSKRLESEKRLLHISGGNNMDGTLNFIPKMNYRHLMEGYSKILHTIYSPRKYYERIKIFLQEYRLPAIKPPPLTRNDIGAFFKSIWKLGLIEKGKRYYWKLLFLGLFRYPKQFATIVTLAIYGFHFRQIVKSIEH
ncbi:DUF4070 domain-containing protein [bacterium]|nr:DUF4070 domain-containing protein [bacterium]